MKNISYYGEYNILAYAVIKKAKETGVLQQLLEEKSSKGKTALQY